MSLEVDIVKKFKGFTLQMQFRSGGGMLGILGASGSGKTLTLKCVAGIEKPDEGRIAVDGCVLFDSAAKIDLKPQARNVGYLFQNYALFPHMTVEQNIGFALSGKKPDVQAQIRSLAERFALEDLLHRYPAQLSGGQQQRAALVRALAAGPGALLLDEPFSALDTHLREKLQLEMTGLLHREYCGDVVLVTHSRDEVYRLCDNLLVLDDGRAMAMGGTKALFKHPGRFSVARLTGCKNISRAHKAGESTAFAEDWETELHVLGPVPEDLAYVGVRAHDFHPAEAGTENAMRFRFADSMENPFEWSVLFQNADAKTPHEIWWMYSKQAGISGVPEYLSVSPEHVLLLTE